MRKCWKCKLLKQNDEFYKSSNRCKSCEKERNRSLKRKEYYFNYNLKRNGELKYIAYQEKWIELIEKQKHKCALCDNTTNLALDHCHTTGKVRGILCIGCNTSLGKLGDTKEKIEEVLKYLSN